MDELFDTWAGTVVWQCDHCGVYGAANIVGTAKLSLFDHVARAHPGAYEDVMGHAPTEESLQQDRYEIMEGI